MPGQVFKGKIQIDKNELTEAKLNVEGDISCELVMADKVTADKVIAQDVVLKNTEGNTTIKVSGQEANLTMGGRKADGEGGVDGDIWLFAKDGDRSKPETATIHLNADASSLRLRDLRGNSTIYLWGEQGNLTMGGRQANGQPGVDGDIWLFAKDGDRTQDKTATIHLDADASGLHLRDREGNTTIYLWGEQGNLRMGGRKADGDEGVDGDIWLFAKDGDRTQDKTATIHLDADASGLRLRDREGNTTIYLWGEQGNLKMGGRQANGKEGVDGDIWLFAKDGDRSKPETATIHMNGETGDFRCKGNMEAYDLCCKGADCAEDFDVSVSEAVEPGTVMVIDKTGGLRPSTEAYDKKVAGIISGAGDLKPGMVLDRQVVQTNRMPVALMGKAYCKVDSQYAPIEVGDLLTTSPTPGHAMKASDPTKAFGAIIGKAIKSLASGTGLIPVLVTLQ